MRWTVVDEWTPIGANASSPGARPLRVLGVFAVQSACLIRGLISFIVTAKLTHMGFIPRACRSSR